jgi:hypothetical protein
MTGHPACCRTHPCDRCSTCLSGTCCLTVPADSLVDTTAVQTANLDRLREAIAIDQATRSTLSDLVRADATTSLIHRVLDAVPRPDPVPVRLVDQPSAANQATPITPAALGPGTPPALPSPGPSVTDLLTQHQPAERNQQP